MGSIFNPQEVREEFRQATNLQLTCVTIYRDVLYQLLSLGDDELVNTVKAFCYYATEYPDEWENVDQKINTRRTLRAYEALKNNVDRSANTMLGKRKGGQANKKEVEPSESERFTDEDDFDPYQVFS